MSGSTVSMIFGLPGAGKTTLLTKIAQKSLAGKKFMGLEPKKIVFTNFECSGCYRLDFDQLGILNYCNCLILIDEIMLLADTRNYQKFPEHLGKFFRLARHAHCQIVVCSQFWDDVDKKIRVITDRFYLLERGRILTNFSFVKPIVRHMGVDNKHMTDHYILGSPLEWSAVYRPKYYKHFDSFAKEDLPPVPLVPWDSPPVDLAKK